MTNLTEIKGTVQEYDGKLYANKLNNLHEQANSQKDTNYQSGLKKE